MNRYPFWKYMMVLVAVAIGLLYTLPNFYGESPAVQVSSAKATLKVEPALMAQIESILAQAKLPANGVYYERNGPLGTVRIRFPSTDVQLQARDLLDKSLNTVSGDPHYTVALNLLPASPSWMQTLGWFEPKPMYLGLDLRGGVHFLLQEAALKQNITTLHNRINELGVAEAVIQQQGADRIVVQLPGVQDVAKAKELLGRTATLEVRMVDDTPAALATDTVPFGLERYTDRNGLSILVRRQVILTGENLQDAQPGRDAQTQQPAVHLTLDAKGARIFRDVTRDNVGKRMAILLFENGKGEVITAPVIRGEIAGGQVQISGSMTAQEAADTALLLRAGALAAPMSIIEERTIGPSLGADNISKGFHSTLYGFIAIGVFIILYYRLFGVFSTIGLAVNLLLLLALLSMLQATLTLPGIAAIALTLGMAIDSNVLINERVREELRNGASPHQAIHHGFERAWGTILDSNLTTLIVGLALLAFGSGPIRGFAVVHCLGILTSMFSSVVGVRALVNLWYGRKKKLLKISVGQIWKPKEH
eukprot:scaffold67.g4556.t1